MKFVIHALAAWLVLSVAAHAQQFAPGAVQGNGTASSAPPRATDINLVLKQKAGASSCVFRENGGSVACGTIATGGIGDAQVTDAKISNRTPLSVFGRSANSSGVGADIAAANDGEVLRRSGTSIGFGAITTAGIGDNQVTDAKLRESAALSLIGRSANSTGNPADIVAAAGSSCVFRENANSIACGTIATAGIADQAVTNAKLANMAQATVKGRAAGAGTGEPTDLTITQVLDQVCSTRGAVLQRGSSVWECKTGTAGQVVTSGGAGADTSFEDATGGGGGGLGDTDRRNILIDRIYQSKALSAVRRGIDTFADGFKASGGINSGASSGYTLNTTAGRVENEAATSYSNSGGTGDRTGTITVSSNGLTGLLGTINNLVDGATGENTTDSVSWDATSVLATDYIKFDFGSAVYITEAKWYQHTPSNNGTWRWQGSNNDSDWTPIGNSFTLGGALTQTQSELANNTVAYRYYRLIGVSGTRSSAPFLQEIEFKIGSELIENITLVTTTQTVASSVSNGRVLVYYADRDAAEGPGEGLSEVALETDLNVRFQCDGADWTDTTLSAAGIAEGGRKIAETADTACDTGGNDIVIEITSANNKKLFIYGVSGTVH